MSERVDSTSDERTRNNVMRHEYRVLSTEEKAQMKAIKDKGRELYELRRLASAASAGQVARSRRLSIARKRR